MTLREVLADVRVVAAEGDLDAEVRGLCYDSRRVARGDVFFGLRGLKQDGRSFVRQALTAGAVAAVVGEDIRLPGATLVQVDEPRLALAQASTRFFGRPSRDLRVVGVTGTNGKTTTTWMLASMFRAHGWMDGVIGTTGVRMGDERRASAFTTPEAPELQGLLRAMAERGVAAVAIEISSHALALRRSHGVECDVVVFTNLSHDHLDFHGTLEAYLDAKLMLFDGRNGGAGAKRVVAVVNADDPAAPRVLEAAARGGLARATYGEAPGADVRLARIRPRANGLAIELAAGADTVAIALPLLGRYNAWNAAAAYAAARALGVPGASAVAGLAALEGVPGRLERIAHAGAFEVVVDYAHTPDALARALAACREHARGRILLVFGCGGDRDRAKRAPMGRAAAAGADRAWVTSDNPRGEDPAAIAAEIVAGAPDAGLVVELDRRAAIAAAIAAARDGDLVLVAGKGHETTQTIGDRVLPFDDREVARTCLGAGGAR